MSGKVLISDEEDAYGGFDQYAGGYDHDDFPKEKKGKDAAGEEEEVKNLSEDSGGDSKQIDITNYDDDKFDIEWDKSKFKVCIIEWFKQGHVIYKIKGEDSMGDFDIQRRYNHFHVLRAVLVKRWPAFFIPPIPPKKAVGNKEEKVVFERWYLLNRFI